MKPTKHMFGFSLLAVVAACSVETSDGDDALGIDVVDDLSTNAKKKDAGADSGTDSGTDGGVDSGTDSGTDSGVDSGTDSGAPSTFVDACLLPGMTTAVFNPTGTIDPNDEGVTSAMTLPFSFTFLGTSYSQYWLTSNGALGFGSTPGGTPFGRVTCPLPDAQVSSPIVFVYSTDLMSGTVCMATTGTAPNRKLVITWKDKAFYEVDGSGNGSSNVAFGATLSEGTNAIDLEIHRVDVSTPFFPPDDFIQGRWATVGLQSGSSATSYSCQQNSAPPGSAFHYTP